MYVEFGNKNQLSDTALNFVKELIDLMKMREIEFHCYFKYPVTNNSKEKFELSILIISVLGLWNVSINSKDRKDFITHFVPMLLKQDSVFEKNLSGTEVYKNYSLDDYPDLSSKIMDNKPVLSIDEIKIFESQFQNSESLNLPSERQLQKIDSIGAMIKYRSQQINTFNSSQFDYINNDNPSKNFRIRGLAGSGKTIIMCKRLAHLHYRYPMMKLAYVFYTVSLKQTIKELFISYYKELSNGDLPNFDNVFILHGWGSATNPGFYSMFCKKIGIDPEPFERDDMTRNNLGSISDKAIKKCIESNISIFDHVFIDEAQDFSLPFFKLAIKSLTPTGGISYAYDELQTLSYSTMPKKDDIFGDKECEDVDLSICYRTPKKILVAAHAFGMGIYRNQNQQSSSLINIPEDKTIWKAIGYVSTPQFFKYGQDVVFHRGEPFSSSFVPDDPVEIMHFNNSSEQIEFLYKEITRLIKKEDVIPEDILIIDLSSNQFEMNYYDFRNYCVYHQNIGKNIESTRLFETHLLNSEERYYFKKSNSIPYTSVFRAKGNESNIVFVINSQNMSDIQSYSRNKIFTAMTRAKFKVYLLGTSDLLQFSEEYNRVKENNYMLKFTYPSRDELKQIKKIAISDENAALDISKILELFDKLKGKENSQTYINVLKEEIQKRNDVSEEKETEDKRQ